MAFPDHNWTITHNANKSYTVSCSNFIEKTKSITLTTTNKNFTGNVSINITCADCGDTSVSGIESSSHVTVDTSSPTLNEVYANGTMRVSIGESGWIQKGSYDLPYNSYKIGTIADCGAKTASGIASSSPVAVDASDLFSSTCSLYASGTMRVSIAESGWIQKGDYDLSYGSYNIGTIYKGTAPYLIGNSETSEVGLSTNGSLNYITVSNSETITVAGATPGYYLANMINNDYNINSHSVGKITKNNLKSVAYISDSRIGGSDARNFARLYPDSIYVVINDGTDFYVDKTGTDVIWSEKNSWKGGSIIWSTGRYWFIKKHDETSYFTAECTSDEGQDYKTCYLNANNYIRRIRIANRVTSGSSTVDESISDDGARIRVTRVS